MNKVANKFHATALLLAAVSGNTLASGFQLIEQSGSGLGNAFAGAAASSEDASTIYFNPAGLTKLPEGKQVVFAAHAISPSAKLSNGTSASAALITPSVATQGLGGDAGSTAAVPNVYFSMPLNKQLVLGVGINAPFGLKTEYDAGWVGRFQALKSEVKTVNVNPTLAYQVNDTVSLGIGADYQKIDATLTKKVNFSSVIAIASSGAVLVPNVEGSQNISGDDKAWGYNLGALFQVSSMTRLGLAYRSEIKYHLNGTQTVAHPTTGNATADFIIGAYPNTQNQNVSLDLTVPATFSASVAHRLGDRWEFLGDASQTGWSKIQEIRIKFTATGSTDDVTNWKLRDTWRLALGANYSYSEQLKARIGIAYDQSPVRDEYRTARLPDNDRTWLSLGGQYKPSKQTALDAGFAYLSVKKAPINSDGGVAAVTGLGYPRGLLNGSYSNSVRILSVQYAQTF